MSFTANLTSDQLTKIIKDGISGPMIDSIRAQIYDELLGATQTSRIKEQIKKQVTDVVTAYVKQSSCIYNDAQSGNLVVQVNLVSLDHK